ncbi:hypothetical protein F3Y22_tig00004111pilonHSYRG00104 [Hibiscus syriacus]|uniref:Uncharacterized protein n=1 Tax=Hibiscus syriacus TaxID=106335 RepID=A0A6A3CM56_HIBSY|nr:hypothetical protein F3Y22_tig00004111pilonHSYRG00104 [Hibiscus syriacus]
MESNQSINEATVNRSSIALLQERFKQLQRRKEKRERDELELLKRLQQGQEEPKQLAYRYDSPSGLFFFHFLPAVAAVHSHHGSGFGCMEAPFFARFLPAVSEETCSTHVFRNRFHDWDLNDDHRVDTSLHL